MIVRNVGNHLPGDAALYPEEQIQIPQLCLHRDLYHRLLLTTTAFK